MKYSSQNAIVGFVPSLRVVSMIFSLLNVLLIIDVECMMQEGDEQKENDKDASSSHFVIGHSSSNQTQWLNLNPQLYQAYKESIFNSTDGQIKQSGKIYIPGIKFDEIKNLHFEPGWHVPEEKNGPYEKRIRQYKGRFVGKDDQQMANIFHKRRENAEGQVNQPIGKIHKPEKEINFDEFKNFIFGFDGLSEKNEPMKEKVIVKDKHVPIGDIRYDTQSWAKPSSSHFGHQGKEKEPSIEEQKEKEKENIAFSSNFIFSAMPSQSPNPQIQANRETIFNFGDGEVKQQTWEDEVKNLHFEPGWHLPDEKKGPYEKRIRQYKGRFVGKDNQKGANIYHKRRENAEGQVNQPIGKIHKPEKEINFDEFKNFIFGFDGLSEKNEPTWEDKVKNLHFPVGSVEQNVKSSRRIKVKRHPTKP